MTKLKFLELQFFKNFTKQKKNQDIKIIIDKLYKFCYCTIMLSSFSQIYTKFLKKNPKQLILSTSKPFVILGLFLYWGVILLGTFLQLN